MAFERALVRLGTTTVVGDLALVLLPRRFGRFDGALVGGPFALKGSLSLGVLLFRAAMLVEDGLVKRLHPLATFLVQHARRGGRGTHRGRTGWGRFSGCWSRGGSRDRCRASASRARWAR